MPFKEGRTLVGWGVVRLSPWEFDGIYSSREEAEEEAAKLGPDFEVYWGENQEGTDNFIFADPDPSPDESDEDGPYLVTEDGNRIVTEDGSPIRLSGDVENGGSEPEQVLSDEELQSIDEMGGPFDPGANTDIDVPYAPDNSVTASSWTGRLSVEEQVTVVRQVGPIAATFVQDLIEAIEAKRLNAPEVQDTLQQLRDLHRALGELIKLAEAGQPLGAVMEVIESHKAKIAESIKNGAQVMFVAPAVACGTAFVLSLLSGFPMSDNMVTALCATMMGKDALLTLAKRTESVT